MTVFYPKYLENIANFRILSLIAMLGICVASNGQCYFSPVSATSYTGGNCNGNEMRSLTGVTAPAYGNNGNLYFTSPLTETIVVTHVNAAYINTLEIYPNPTSNYVTIEWPFNIGGEINIYNNVGQIIIKSKVSAHTTNQFDISSVLAGYYLIKITSDTQQTYINKLIKQ